MSNITKHALAESLKKLLLKKPLNKITINDLTTDCGISRMAFYYHFKDIYDLVEWVCLEESRGALQGKKTYRTRRGRSALPARRAFRPAPRASTGRGPPRR